MFFWEFIFQNFDTNATKIQFKKEKNSDNNVIIKSVYK